MKKYIMVVIALLYSFIGVNMVFAAADTWTQKADFGGAGRISAVGFSIGNKAYIGTGDSWVFTKAKDFWEYDPITNIWTQKADFGGTARYNAVGFSIGSKGYLGTGDDSLSSITESNTKDFWEYDPAGNTWTRKADFGGIARHFAVGFSIGSKGYIGTGMGASSVLKDFWEYDPSTDTWTQKTDFGGTARGAAVGFSIGNKAYIGTGPSTIDFWEYDPITNMWTQKADFGGTARHYAVGFSVGSKGYLGTGLNSPAGNLKDFWEYNPTTNTWTQKADFGGTERYHAVGFSIGDKGYIGTGYAGPAGTKTLWEYEPIDTIPDQFTFNYETGVALNTVITSNTITVTGINAAASISVSGGTYSINGGAYTSDSGTVNNGDTVTAQQTSASIYATTTIATLTIGGVSDTFRVTTQDVDTTPDPFTFTDQTNVALNTVITSNAITVSGINIAAPISILSGTYSINGGAYKSTSGTVVNGNTVRVKKTSAGTYSTTKSATLTIGGVSDTFNVTTRTAP